MSRDSNVLYHFCHMFVVAVPSKGSIETRNGFIESLLLLEYNCADS